MIWDQHFFRSWPELLDCQRDHKIPGSAVDLISFDESIIPTLSCPNLFPERMAEFRHQYAIANPVLEWRSGTVVEVALKAFSGSCRINLTGFCLENRHCESEGFTKSSSGFEDRFYFPDKLRIKTTRVATSSWLSFFPNAGISPLTPFRI
jgi:hypothetical protein